MSTVGFMEELTTHMQIAEQMALEIREVEEEEEKNLLDETIEIFRVVLRLGVMIVSNTPKEEFSVYGKREKIPGVRLSVPFSTRYTDVDNKHIIFLANGEVAFDHLLSHDYEAWHFLTFEISGNSLGKLHFVGRFIGALLEFLPDPGSIEEGVEEIRAAKNTLSKILSQI